MPHLTPRKLPTPSLFAPPSNLLTPPSSLHQSSPNKEFKMPNLRPRAKPDPSVEEPTEGRGLLARRVKLGKRPAPIDEEVDPDEDEVEAMRRRKRLRLEREQQLSEQQEEPEPTPSIPERRLGRGLRPHRSTRRKSSSTISVISHITPPTLSPLRRAAYYSEEALSESPDSSESTTAASNTSSLSNAQTSTSSSPQRGRSRKPRILNHQLLYNPPKLLSARPSDSELLIDPASTPFTLAASQQNSPLKPGKRKRLAKGVVKKRGRKEKTGGGEEQKELQQPAITRFFKAVGNVFGYSGKEKETETAQEEDEEMEEGDSVEGHSDASGSIEEEREDVHGEGMVETNIFTEKVDDYDEDEGDVSKADDNEEGEVSDKGIEEREPSIPTTITTEPTAETRASQQEDEVEDRIDAYFNSMEVAAEEHDNSTMGEIGIQRSFLLSSPVDSEEGGRMQDEDVSEELQDHWTSERPMTPRSPKPRSPRSTSPTYGSFSFVPSTNIPATGLFSKEDSEDENAEDERASRSKETPSTDKTIQPTSDSDRHDTVKRSGLPNFIADFFNRPKPQDVPSSLTTSIPLSNSDTTIITVKSTPTGPIPTEEAVKETENGEEPKSRRTLVSTQQAMAFFKDVSGLGTQRWARLVGAPTTVDEKNNVGKEGDVVQKKQVIGEASKTVQVESSQPPSSPPYHQTSTSPATIVPSSPQHRLPSISPPPLRRLSNQDSSLITPPTSESTTPQTVSQSTTTEQARELSTTKQPIVETLPQVPNSPSPTGIESNPAHEHDEYCAQYPELCAGEIVTFPVNSSPISVSAEASFQSTTPHSHGDSGAQIQQKLRTPSPKLATLRKEESMPRVFIAGACCDDISHAVEDASPLRATLQKEDSMPRVYTSGVCFDYPSYATTDFSSDNLNAPPTLQKEESMPRVYVAGRCFSAPTHPQLHLPNVEIKQESLSLSLPVDIPSLTQHQTSHVHDEFCAQNPETCRGIYEDLEERDGGIKMEPVWD